MRVAITADVHLRSKQEAPELCHALEHLLAQRDSMGLGVRIVTGDLSHNGFEHTSELKRVCGDSPWRNLSARLHATLKAL